MLLQTVETVQLPHMRQLLKSANRLIQQQRLKAIVRFVCEEIEPLPEGWETIHAVDATENQGIASQQLAQFILHASNPSTNIAEQALPPYLQVAR